MRRVAAILITLWAGACASRAAGPPVIALDRSACTKCGMLISEQTHAAAIRLSDGTDQLFDDIGCLVAAIRRQSPDGAQYWFHDGSDGTWIEAVAPVFVAAPSLRTPMGGGIVAFRNRASAERFAVEHSGRVVGDVTALVADAGSGRAR